MVTATILPRITGAITILFLILLFSYPVIAADSTTSATRKEKIEARKEATLERTEAKKTQVAQKVETLKEKMASREAALKAKLAKFKDKKKAQAAERINTNLNMINKNQTDSMLKHLGKMSEILAKVESRGNNSSITDAKTKISSATAAVKEQAEKDYSLTITSESTARTEAQKLRDLLHTDLQSVRKQVIAAKQAVSTAIRTTRSEGGTGGQ